MTAARADLPIFQEEIQIPYPANRFEFGADDPYGRQIEFAARRLVKAAMKRDDMVVRAGVIELAYINRMPCESMADIAIYPEPFGFIFGRWHSGSGSFIIRR